MMIRLLPLFVFSCLLSGDLWAQVPDEKLAERVLENENLHEVFTKGSEILKTGFNAGSGYSEVWIRDLNTFITYACRLRPSEEVRSALMPFFNAQGFDGNIIDGYQAPGNKIEIDNYHVFARHDMPGYALHKNTVETDQETSLIQAVYKYIEATGDHAILSENVNELTVLQRLEYALDFLLKYRFNKQYGLIWGAATADWGDVQPGHSWGVKLDEYSTPAIDIYDNAMLLIALENLMEMSDDASKTASWEQLHTEIKQNIRLHLYDNERQKFIPHIYITCSPFEGFDENDIYYHGGTAVAIEAGLLTPEEVLISLNKMRDNVTKSGAQSIGLTLYPPYPQGSFHNEGMNPYSYQNGGDWTWFGGRMITQLIKYGYIEEAYTELQPFVDRVVKNDGFFEWYTIEGKPHGSGVFRGSAGVLMQAIEALQNWAREQQTTQQP